MTKHSLCIRDYGQIPKSRLEGVCSPTLYPDTNVPSAFAHFHGNRKQRSCKLRQLSHNCYCSSAPSPTEAMRYSSVLASHWLWYMLLPKTQPAVCKECAWVSIVLWNLLSTFLPNWSCLSMCHRPYLQFNMEGDKWNLHHQHVRKAVVTSPAPHRCVTLLDLLPLPFTATGHENRASAVLL